MSSEPPAASTSARPAADAGPATRADAAVDPVIRQCNELERQHAAVLARSPLAVLSQDRPGLGRYLPESFGKCHRTPRGAWIAAITSVAQDPPSDVACWSLIHVDETGHLASAFPPPIGGAAAPSARGYSRCGRDAKSANLVYGIVSSVRFMDPILSDFDGDGEPEIFWRREGKHDNHPVEGTDLLWTYRSGVVLPYPPTRGVGVVRIEDADGDGRLDLLTHDPFRTDGTGRCGTLSAQRFPVTGPLLLGRGLPDGTYSFDDEPALKYVQRQCPARPPQIGGPGRQVGLDIACALLWGRDERWIRRKLASCSKRLTSGYEPDCPEWCDQDRDFVEKFVAADLPLRLNRKPRR